MRRSRARANIAYKEQSSSSSEDEEIAPKTPVKKLKVLNDSDSSSSESDIEAYLKKPNQLNLKSSFFKKSPTSEEKVKKLEKSKGNLSDSEDSTDEENETLKENVFEAIASTSAAAVAETSATFDDIKQCNQELEDAKKQMEAYIARTKQATEKTNVEIENLLALGESSKEELQNIGFHPSDFLSGSESEKEDWEVVQESKEVNLIPKEGIQITLNAPELRKSKKIDLMAVLKRRINRVRKENQVWIHKVHILIWIAHGNFVNDVINKQNVMAAALSMLPNKECFPPEKSNLKYLQQISKWFHNTVKIVDAKDDKTKSLEEQILHQIGKKQANSNRILVFIFVALLRALGLQCRVVFSLQVLPLKPSADELCILKKESSTEKSGKNKKTKSSSNNSNAKKNVKKTTQRPKRLGEEIEPPKSPKISKRKATSKKLETEKEDIKLNTSKSLKNNPGNSQKKAKEVAKSKSNSSKEKKETVSSSKRTAKTKVSEVKKSQEKPQSQEKSTSKNSVIIETANSKKSNEKTPAKSSSSKTRQINKNVEINSKETVGKVLKSPNLTVLNEKKTEEEVPKKKRRVSSRIAAPKKETAQKDSNKGENLSKSGDSPKKTIFKILDVVNSKVSLLESLESSKKNKTDTDEDVSDRSLWRRSKNQPKTIPKNDDKIVKNLESKDKKSKSRKFEQVQVFSSSQESDSDQRKKPNFKVKLPTLRKKLVPQADGTEDTDEELRQTRRTAKNKPRLKALTSHSSANDTQSENDFKPKPSLPATPNLKNLQKSSSSGGNRTSGRSSISSYFGSQSDVTKDVVNIVKKSMKEQRRSLRTKQVNYRKDLKDDSEDVDSDFAPEPVTKRKSVASVGKRRIPPKSELQRKVFTSSEDETKSPSKSDKGINFWAEVYLEEEQKWVSSDIVFGKVDCVKDIYNKATHLVSYIFAWDQRNRIKDVTKRYCPNWNTVTRKLRVDPKWLEESLRPFIGMKTAQDCKEDKDLAMLQLEQPLPKTISEYKDHPLYVLPRHLLKFQAIYPPDAPTLGYIRGEPVYSRNAVYVLHSRDIWLKHAKVVRKDEKPYKIVKARPKYDKLSNSVITDQNLEIFGEWQVEDYEPPTAENGIVPRNAYGNVDLFKESMLPKKTAHLRLPGLNKVARKLNIDCAPAVIGFDFHSGWSHPTFDGFVVCEEFKEVLVDAWNKDQDEQDKKEIEKYEKRVFGNWRKLIKAALIWKRLKTKYNFGQEKPEEKEEAPKRKKPRFTKNR